MKDGDGLLDEYAQVRTRVKRLWVARYERNHVVGLNDDELSA